MNEQEILFDTFPGIRYDILQSTNPQGPFTALLSTHTGTGSRMSVIYPINKNEPKRYFAIKQHIPEGSEPVTCAIVAWESPYYVLLEWNSMGPPVAGSPKFRIERNGTLLATLPATQTSYKDTTVQSGQRYEYAVKYFAS
jgi:hypothetical protein